MSKWAKSQIILIWPQINIQGTTMLHIFFFTFKEIYYAYYQAHGLIYLTYLFASSAAALYVWNALF